MGLVNPWLLFGLAALAVPVLVHLAQREEHRGQKFPSLMFLRRIPFDIKRRRRIRDRALLALRCLALAAVVIGFAAPEFDMKPNAASNPAGGRDVVILLDRSYSMSHPQRWQRAMDAAAERIDALASGDRAALVGFDYSARIDTELTADKALLHASLRRTEPGEGRTGYAAAFGAANHILARSNAQRHEIVLISDLQRSALDDSGALPLGDNVALEIVAVTGTVGANATIIDARLAPQQEGAVEDALLVRVQNTGDAPLLDAQLELTVDGRLTEARPLILDAGETRALTVPLVLAADRPTRVMLEVGPDALPADDRYYLVLASRRPVAVALIEPEHARAHQGVFLEEALRLARMPAVDVERLRLDEINETRLEPFDVVVLDDVPIAPGPIRDAVAAFVARGGGLLAIAGPSVGAAWPGESGGFLPQAHDANAVRADGGNGVELSAADHPLWNSPGLDRGDQLSAATVSMLRRMKPEAGDRVLARLGNGAPLLTERITGAGRALALGTTADPRWGTLALEPAFVPFAQASVAYLAGRAGWSNGYLAGDVVDLFRAAGQLGDSSGWRAYLSHGGAVVVETPSGIAERIERPGGAFFTARRAGLHEVHRVDGGGPSLPFAVNVSRAESVLTAAPAAEIERRIVRRARSAFLGGTGTAGVLDADPFGAARWLLVAAGVALIVESLLASRISRRRRLKAMESLG